MNADEILVLTEQGIVEKGKHQELLDRHGFYHELYYGNQWSQNNRRSIYFINRSKCFFKITCRI